MLGNRNIKSAKISIEIALSIVMTVCILFFAIGLFGGNVKAMSSSSNSIDSTQVK